MAQKDALSAPATAGDRVQHFRTLVQERRQAHGQRLQAELARLVEVLAALPVEQVILFGSAAREQTGLTSDLDLLVVWDTELPFLERTVALYRVLDTGVAVDLLVYTPEEMRQMADRPFMRRIRREGKVLYAT
jgi:predicted nucleotidyltransferase